MADSTFSLVRDYLRAAARLYGRIRLYALYCIFTHHNGGRVTAETFYRVARQAEGPNEIFRIIGDDDIYRADISVPDMDRWLVHRQYCYATWDSFFTLECNHQGKMIRLFSKDQMRVFAMSNYFPGTTQFRDLSDMLKAHSSGEFPLTVLVMQALALAESDCDAPTFLREMQRLGCRFGSMEDRLQAAYCYKGVYDTVPKPIHNGNSERELQILPITTNPLSRYYLWFCLPKEDDPFHLVPNGLTEVLPSTGKTEHQRFLDRCLQCQTLPPRLFDPCPCGSGLYYTDCCGKR